MRVEKTIELPAEASVVWNALTNPEITKRYFYGCEAISDWKVGGPLVFKTAVDGVETIPVKGVITAIEPNRFLEHTCFASEDEADASKHTTVAYTLVAKGDSTELSIAQGDFPEDDSYEQHLASWDYVLNGLKSELETQR